MSRRDGGGVGRGGRSLDNLPNTIVQSAVEPRHRVVLVLICAASCRRLRTSKDLRCVRITALEEVAEAEEEAAEEFATNSVMVKKFLTFFDVFAFFFRPKIQS